LTPQEIWEQLAAARYALIELGAFEQWIYKDQELDAIIGQDHYLALISFVFNQPHAQHELTRVIDRLYDNVRPSHLRRDAAMWMARAFLNDKCDLVTTARMLTRFRSAGETWVPTEFAYINSELDEIPMPAQYSSWNEQALAAKLAEWQPRLVEFERAARDAARGMLLKLEQKARG